jgi:molybdopterin synthase catalytic subunit
MEWLDLGKRTPINLKANLCLRFLRVHSCPFVDNRDMTHDWIQLHDEPIEMGPVIEFVSDAEAGGIAVFLGTTRAETSADGRALIALDYEAYADMARQQMADLARRAREKWRIRRVAVLHRTGRVCVGQPSVIIAVATPHRAEAFDACRWLIDTLKAEVPVWKKEIWDDGRERWVVP